MTVSADGLVKRLPTLVLPASGSTTGPAVGPTVALPRVTLAVTRPSGECRLSVQSEGSTQPLTDLRVTLSLDASSWRVIDQQPGAAASGWNVAFSRPSPTLLQFGLTSTPARPVGVGELAVVRVQPRDGRSVSGDPAGLLAVAGSSGGSSGELLRPAARAGPSLNLSSAQLSSGRIWLDGRSSSDSQTSTRPLSYRWRQLAGPAIALENATAVTPSFVPAGAGLYQLGLVVSNGTLDSPTAEVAIGLDRGEIAPAAKLAARVGWSAPVNDASTAPVEAVTGIAVLLDARESSGPQGAAARYSWRQVGGPAIGSTTGSGPLFEFVPTRAGLYDLELRVTGSTGVESRPAAARIRVRPGGTTVPALTLSAMSGSAQGTGLGEAPLLAAPQSLRVQAGASVTLAATLGGATQGQLNSFYWTQESGPAVPFTQRGGAEDATRSDSYLEFVPRRAGVLEFRCRVRQSPSGLEVEQRLRVVVDETGAAVPRAQAATSLAASAGWPSVALGVAPVEALPGAVVQLSGTGVSTSGSRLRYAWVQVAGPEPQSTEPQSATFVLQMPDLPGEHLLIFHLFADDGRSSEPAALAILVRAGDHATVSTPLGQGLNLVGVPVKPGLAQPYSVQDLAVDAGSPFVAWPETGSDGRRRFRTWLAGDQGAAPEVAPTTGYVLFRRQEGETVLSLSGTAWPSAQLVRSLAPGVELLAYPRGAPAGRNASDLLVAAGAPLVARFTSAASARTRAQAYLPLAMGGDFPLEAGRAYVVPASVGSLDLAALPSYSAALRAARDVVSAGISLGRGWNLVSLPVAGSAAGPTAQALAAALTANGALVTRLRRWSGSVFEEFLAGPPASGVDFAVQYGAAYLAYNAGEPATISLSGSRLEGTVASLAAGFNLLGSTLDEPRSGSQLASSVAGISAVMALSGSRWRAYLPGSPDVSSEVALARGGGVALRAGSAGQLTLGTVTPPSLSELTLPDSTAGVPMTVTLSAPAGTLPLAWSLSSGALPAGLSLSAEGVLSGTPSATGRASFNLSVANSAGSAAAVCSLAVLPPPAGAQYAGTNVSGRPEFRVTKDDSVLTELPAASFGMGSTTASASASLADTDETPVHQVGLSRFLLGNTEVTNEQYARFLAATAEPAGPYWHQGHHPGEPLYKDHTPYGWTGAGASTWSTSPAGPVVGVDWYDAYAYCAWAGLRLPTEAELEYAARGTDGRAYPWGDDGPWSGGGFKANTGRIDACCSEDAGDGFLLAAPVGSYGPAARAPLASGQSPFGLLDLSGNAWEWARDWYGERTYSSGPFSNPRGPASGSVRVMKGGGYYHSSYYQRSAYRGFDTPSNRFGSYGFRVALSFEPTILTTSLPAARRGTQYSAQLVAGGLDTPAWSVAEGVLPTGVTLSASGLLSGVPQVVTVASFTALATTARGYSERSYLLFVDPDQTTQKGLNGMGYREFTNDRDGSLMVEVPASAFAMGSTSDAVAAGTAATDELPLHAVSLSRYFLGKFEVGNQQYARFLAATADAAGPFWHQGHHPSEPLYKDHTPYAWSGAGSTPYSTATSGPVVGVDWYDAYAYCAWAGLRLPTEAEFEYAARNSDGRIYPWGNDEPGAGGLYRASAGRLSECCAEDGSDGFLYAAPGGSFGPEARAPRANGQSPFGVLDLAGNAWEWQRDWYGPEAYGSSAPLDPTGPSGGAYRVLRGGGWYNSAFYQRSAYRGYDEPTSRYGSYGFRVALSFEPTIVTTSLPAALQGTAYRQPLSASGTLASTWSVVAGQLATGLALSADGVLSGVPRDVSVVSFTARAVNGRGMAERSYLLFVDPAGTSFARYNDRGFRELTCAKDGSTLVEIPAGTFGMGSTTASVTALAAESAELPLHTVSLSRYFVGKFEVTNGQYQAFLAATSDPAGPSQHQGHHAGEPSGKDHTPYAWNGTGSPPWSPSSDGPVVGIDWYDAYAYCVWAGLRLPSEAEWEYAARGTDYRLFPWGDDAVDSGGTYRCSAGNLSTCCSDDTADGYQYAAPVGRFGAGAGSPRSDGRSPFGVHDLAGNVWEWAADWFSDGAYAASPAANPPGPAQGSTRVLRGGSWYNTGYFARSAYRGYDYPDSRYGSYGFRVAR